MDFDPEDQGMFVRSLATAGDAGGLAHAANAGVEVLAAAYDRVLVETIGVGQSETDGRARRRHACVSVVQPGSGDVLQFIKAGIMEIPDVLVVNKGDQALARARGGGPEGGAVGAACARAWARTTSRVPVLVTSARDRQGIDALLDALEAHLNALVGEALEARRRDGAVHWTLSLVQRRHGEYAIELLGGRDALRDRVQVALTAGRTPLSLTAELGSAYLAAVRTT